MNKKTENFLILSADIQDEYELIDSGDGMKLERFGEYVVSRPDPQALWKQKKSQSVWGKADAVFSGTGKSLAWKFRNDMPREWEIHLHDLTFIIRLASFKHVGVFPEHVSQWEWIEETIQERKEPVSVLNLFGYTGGATLAAARAGAEVCHLDGSKVAIQLARDNAERSGLGEKPIRWILDDARMFLKREIKRGHTYDAIIMDPPIFGHGPDGELWKIEKHLEELLGLCRKVLSKKPLFVIMNGYAAGYSAIAYKNNLEALMDTHEGEITYGELAIRELEGGRMLPAGIFARWKALK